MNNRSLVSVIINCYNGDTYLKQAIDSVIAQTYQNWEIIFWDNRSNDNSKNIIKLYKDHRIKYFLAPKHTSLYKARNCAIEKSLGEFIAFLDVDDWWIPTKLEQQIPFFENKEVGLVYSNFVRRNESTGRDSIAHKKKLPNGYILEDVIGNYMIGLLTIIVRKKAYEQLQLKFNPQYNIIGDFDFCVRLAAKWKFMCVQSPTAYYRLHECNLHINEEERHIYELQNWIHYYSGDLIFSKNPGFQKLEINVNKMYSIVKAKNGDYKSVLKGFFLHPGFTNKIKILIAIILPPRVLRFLVNRFY